jgi:transcriptional regulator with XRE-family HTH domain
MTPFSRRIRKDYKIPELNSMLKNVAIQLITHREQLGISQNELAKRANISKTTVNDLENEVAVDLQLSTLCLLAKAVKKRPIELISESDFILDNGDRKTFIKAVEDLNPIWRALERVYRRIR